jgi:serine protease
VTTPLISSGADGVNITVQDIDPRGQITLTNDLTIPVNPTLAVSPSSLNFGAALNSLNFTVKNSGYGGEINWTASPTEGWVSVNPASGQITNNTEQVTVTVDRTGLVAGDYTAVIDLNSDNGTATVTVNMTVP